VVSEVYALVPLRCEPHILLSLALFKLVDPALEVGGPGVPGLPSCARWGVSWRAMLGM
jgi:hypothetical protein